MQTSFNPNREGIAFLQTNSNAGKDNSTEAVNAFGIGPRNQPELELSAQARILQQNERQQNERNNALEEPSSEQQLAGTDFVRVSSSVGTSARNNLTSEQATQVYKSIQELL